MSEKNFQTFDPCVCCGRVFEGGNCFHHLMTRKAYPEHSQKRWNMIPVCQVHHNEFHAKGTGIMSVKYPGVYDFLDNNGWEIDNTIRKWRHYESDRISVSEV